MLYFFFDMKRIIGSDKHQKTRCNVTWYRFEEIENIPPKSEIGTDLD